MVTAIVVLFAVQPKQKRLQTPHTLALCDAFSYVQNTMQVKAFVNSSASATQQFIRNCRFAYVKITYDLK